MTSLTESQELIDVDEKLHGVFAEDLVADLLTEHLLPLSDGGSEGDIERPVRLPLLLPGGFGPQLGSDEGEEGGEQPLGAD